MPRPDSVIARLRKQQKAFANSLNMGQFSGDFALELIGPNLFMYHPDPDDPFRYERNRGEGKKPEIIVPEQMTTDGGSIPRLAQILPGLSPWEYGPAYLIHDWEFHRHDIDKGFRKSFKQVNLTLAEGIWTLMNKGYKGKKPSKIVDNVLTIYSGVMSPIGRHIWDTPGR